MASTSRSPRQSSEEAAELLRVLEGSLGRDHVATLCAASDLGDIYADQGKLAEAERMYMRVMEGCLQKAGWEHASTLTTARKLGCLYLSQGRLNEAEGILHRTLHGLEKNRGRHDEATLETLSNLAMVFAGQGRPSEAEAAYKRALKGMQETLGRDHELVLTTANNLALLYKDYNMFDEAEKMYDLALPGLQRTLGMDHTLTLTAMNGMGMLRKRQGRLEEAETMLKQAMEGNKRTIGMNSTPTLDTINNLGNVYALQGKPVEAEETYKLALQGWERVHGWDHQSTLNTANNLRLHYVDQGKPEDAARMAERVCAGTCGCLEKNMRLHRAAQEGEVRILQLLLPCGFPVDMRSISGHDQPFPNGCTALSVAVSSGNATFAASLLAAGADVDGADWDALTPLNLAVEKNHLRIAQLLLDHGARVNGLDVATSPPLVTASSKGLLDMTKLLLQRGAQVDALDSDGDPALHSAAFSGHIELVRLLLDHGADPRTKGGSGRTARWFASEQKHEAVAQLLRERGADDQDLPDMRNDDFVSFGSIGFAKLLGDAEVAQTLMMDADTVQWAASLRFIVQVPGSQSQQHYLELIEESPDSTEPFLAVSYCRNPADGITDSRPLTVRDTRSQKDASQALRPARAPSDILLRSLRFAESQGINRIWIDQECIDQDDEEDARAASQSMHLVYQRAKATVVILGKNVHTTDDIVGLSNLIPRLGTTMFDPPSDRIRDRILGDRWFTRAWCTPAFVNSDSIYYLVGWKDGLDEDEEVWSRYAKEHNEAIQEDTTTPGTLPQTVSREWVISKRYLFTMTFYGVRAHDNYVGNIVGGAPTGGPREFTLLDEDMEETQLHRRLGSMHLDANRDIDGSAVQRMSPLHLPARRLRMSIVSAITTLHAKRSVLTSDRLTILSNMTRHAYIIDTKKAIETNLSYTACVLALALQNGDFGSFGFFGGGKGGGEASDRISTNGNSSWLPRPGFSLSRFASAASGDFLSRQSSGHPAYVVGKKGLFSGLLWDIEAYNADGFSDVRQALPDLFQLACDPQAEPALWMQIILQLLIRHFISAGHSELAELIMLSALTEPLSSPEQAHEIFSSLEAWAHDGNDEDWPSEWHTRAPRGVVNLQANRGQDQPPLGAHPLGRPLLYWICSCIASGRSLPVGRCHVGSEYGVNKSLVGFFNVTPARDRKVFTPLDGLEYHFGHGLGRLLDRTPLFGAMEVVEGSRPSDEDTQKALDLLNSKPCCSLDPKLYHFRQLEDRKAVWSHRLSRNGILEMDSQVGRTTIPFGQCGSHRGIEFGGWWKLDDG